jgi:dipeptidyl aminopeptidase/acylaminoacyl peptidase
MRACESMSRGCAIAACAARAARRSRHMRLLLVVVLPIAVVPLFCLPPCGAAESDPDAVLRAFLGMSDFGVVRISPDGNYAAVEIRRPRSDTASARGELSEELRTDLWLLDVRTGDIRPIVRGGTNGSGAWAPVWAPNSRSLAFVTNRETPGIPRLVVYSLSQREVIYETTEGISLDANFGSPSPYPPIGRVPLQWIGDDRIIAVLMPEGSVNPLLVPDLPVEPNGTARATGIVDGRSRTTWDTRELVPCGRENRLVAIDIGRHTLQPLLSGAVRAVSLAPDSSSGIVVRALGPYRRPLTGVMRSLPDYNAYSLDPNVETEALWIDLKSATAAEPRISGWYVPNLSSEEFPRWSQYTHDAYVPVLNSDGQAFLFRFDGRSAPELLGSGKLVQIVAIAEVAAHRRTRLNPKLFETLSANIDRLYSDSFKVVAVAKNYVAAIGAGKMRLLDDSGRVSHITVSTGDASMISPIGPAASPSTLLHSAPLGYLRVVVERGRLRLTELRLPTRVTELVGVGEGGTYIVRYAKGLASGIGLVRGNLDIQSAILINSHLNQMTLRPPTVVDLGASGAPRLARLYYPNGDASRAHLPTAIIAYPGLEFRSAEKSVFFGRTYQHSLAFDDLETYYLAAAGFLVVKPSIPLDRSADSDIFARIAGEIDSAAHTLVERGVTDGRRLGYFGHSYGGFAGLAVAVDSKQFAAIVVSAAFADIYYYANYVPSYFRGEACAPSAVRLRAYELESNPTVLNMAVPPFRDPERYLRNSATFRAQEITTPLLMLHGQYDGVPVESTEELFMELESRNVPARLVRYWGEGHNFQDGADIENALSETRRWFIRYLNGNAQ